MIVGSQTFRMLDSEIQLQLSEAGRTISMAGVIALATVCCLVAGAQTSMLSGEMKQAGADDSSTAPFAARTVERTDKRQRGQGAQQETWTSRHDSLCSPLTDERTRLVCCGEWSTGG